MHSRSLIALFALASGVLTFRASGPQAQEPPAQTPALTLHAESRIVLADITVTDRNGNPVHGLSATDFQVLDNGHPQRIASFEENKAATTEALASPATPPPNLASNTDQHLPPVLNCILLDTTNLELEDQMYLRLQLTNFLAAQPPRQLLAIFERHGDNTVLLQAFTSDHALLQSAVNQALPRFVATGRTYRSDTDTLRQMIAYLSQVPGRKNVFWFSGGSTAYLLAGLSAIAMAMPTGPPPALAGAALSTLPTGDDADVLRRVYDDLEAARIAIYPIDARGLTTEVNPATPMQQSQMSEIARSTGGQAIFNTNDLAGAAAHLVRTSSISYTLTYSPQNFRYDGKWHNIAITVRDPSLHLSYRRGYFADPPHSSKPSGHTPKALFAGDTVPVTPPDRRSAPLLFTADVRPASEPGPTAKAVIHLQPRGTRSRGGVPFRIVYSLTTTGITPALIDGASQATIVFAATALNSYGTRVGRARNMIRFPLDASATQHRLEVEQPIDLPRGSSFLTLAIWDPVSGHIGTAQITVTAGAKK